MIDLRSEATGPASAPLELASGAFAATFLPGQGMLCASLRHRGEELLRCVDDLPCAAARGSMAGVPLMHPWANRLGDLRYHAAGRDVLLDPALPILRFDRKGLPIHGVPWALLAWHVVEATGTRIVAWLDWNRSELLAVFPFEHAMEMTVVLGPVGLRIATTLHAGESGPVPVSFGFHPYLGLPGLPREEWRLTLPSMRRLTLDTCGIPTGDETAFAALDRPLGDIDLDDGFAVESERASFELGGAGRRVCVDLLAGFRYVQVYAPRGRPYVAMEPMTAPANALASGSGLRIVPANGRFETAFRIRVENQRTRGGVRVSTSATPTAAR